MGRPAILKVDILADAGKAKAELNDAESRFGKFGKSAAAAGKVAALGLAAGLAGAAVAAVKLAQGAAEDDAAAQKLATSLKNAAGATDSQVAATERWITKQGQALGVSDDELRPALSRLAVATGSVGEAQKLASLAMDVSAGTGKSLEQVTEALAKAQNGQVGGLGRLGVATKDAAGKTLGLDQITGQLAKNFGGQAATAANTASGQYGRLKLQMGELGESIGGKLLPIGTKLAGWALDMLPKAQRLGSELADRLGPAFRAVGSFISERVVPAIRSLADWFTEKLAPAIGNVVRPLLARIRESFAGVADKIQENKPAIDKLVSAARVMAEFFIEKILPLMGKQLGVSFKIAGFAIGAIIDLIGGITNAVSTAVGWIRSLVGWIGKIHIPNLSGLGKIAGLVGGAVGNLTLTRTPLTGGSPSFDGRGGWTSAALGDAPTWSTMSTGQLSNGAVYVDARSFPVSVDAAGGINDPRLIAQLDQLLREHQARSGRAPAFGANR